MTRPARERIVSLFSEIAGVSPAAHGIRAKGLSVARATSTEGRPLHRIPHLSHTERESLDGVMMSEKRLRELRGGTIPPSLSAADSEQTSVMPDAAFESYRADHRPAP